MLITPNLVTFHKISTTMKRYENGKLLTWPDPVPILTITFDLLCKDGALWPMAMVNIYGLNLGSLPSVVLTIFI